MDGKKFPIRPVLEHYGAENLPHRGGWAKILCIVHDDNSASASFHEEEGKFHCFTCGFSGDALDVIQAKEGNTWHEAVELAKAITGSNGSFTKSERPAPGRCRAVRIGDVTGGGAPRPRQAGSTTKTAGRQRPRRIT